MSKYVQWIEHKGKKILFNNYSGLEGEEYLRAIDETKQELLKQPVGSRVLTLTDTSNSRATVATKDKAKEQQAAIKEKRIVTCAAIVGVSGWQKVIAQLIRGDVYFAQSVEDAKDWLVEQADE